MDGNLLFKDLDDCYRGIFSIYEFNNANPVSIRRRREIRKAFKNKIHRGRASADFADDRERMADILCFSFMPNHIHLMIVFAYIHTNAISLIYKDWKNIRINEEDFNKIIKFLEKYKWHSYPDYLGIKNFPSITQRDFILEEKLNAKNLWKNILEIREN